MKKTDRRPSPPNSRHLLRHPPQTLAPQNPRRRPRRRHSIPPRIARMSAFTPQCARLGEIQCRRGYCCGEAREFGWGVDLGKGSGDGGFGGLIEREGEEGGGERREEGGGMLYLLRIWIELGHFLWILVFLDSFWILSLFLFFFLFFWFFFQFFSNSFFSMFSYSLFFKMDFRTLFLNSFCIFSILFIFSVIFNSFSLISSI